MSVMGKANQPKQCYSIKINTTDMREITSHSEMVWESLC